MPPTYPTPPSYLRGVGPGAHWAMPAKPRDPSPRVIIPIPKALIRQIDDYRWANRIPSRAEAIRQLIKTGLKTQP
jgi:hypothetical protein